MKETKSSWEKLHTIALKAPSKSGVYFWRDSTGLIIYVGKAVNLKKRLSSYFCGQKDIKTRLLISHADTIEYITTDNEYEALILENNLIKQHTPRFNISLKDDKSYPMLRVTNEHFPRVFKTRRMISDGSVYYGPFPNVQALDNFIAMIEKYYKLRKCRRFAQKETPCLYYHIGRCAAPCCGKITEAKYAQLIAEIVSLLDGGMQGRAVAVPPVLETSTAAASVGSDGVSQAADTTATPVAIGSTQLESLTERMKIAAAELRFEEAARLRDGIRAITELCEQNVVQDFDPEGRDYIACASEGTLVSFIVLKMRSGRVVGRDMYRARSLDDEEDLLPDFLVAYYENNNDIPPRIFVPSDRGLVLTREWFERNIRAKPSILKPHDARSQAAMAMAQLNAKEDIVRRVRERGDFPALKELQQLFSLPSLPSRIEGFDIAHINGRLPVASLVSFKDGNPDKKEYRYFRLKTTDGIIDDFASMREAVSRRYTRLLNEHAEMPDLILIDGGAGQIHAVTSVLGALGLDIPVAGLAKRDEEIWLPEKSEPIRLPRRSDALRLLQRVRDETHRFATSRNQRLRTKENITAIFESIDGIGKIRALKLMRSFVTLDAFCEATPEAVAAAAGISIELAKTALLAGVQLLKERQSTIQNRRSIDTGGYSVSVAEQAVQDSYFSAGSNGATLIESDESPGKQLARKLLARNTNSDSPEK